MSLLSPGCSIVDCFPVHIELPRRGYRYVAGDKVPENERAEMSTTPTEPRNFPARLRDNENKFQHFSRSTRDTTQ